VTNTQNYYKHCKRAIVYFIV